MSLIYPLVADANCPVAEKAFVNNIVAPVEDFFCKHFKIGWKVNATITTSLPWLIISEDGVGGKTDASDFIVLSIDQQNATIYKPAEILAHELAHAVRWGKNSEWSKDLFCELVNEGLAVHVEAEFAKTQTERTFFLETVLGRSDEENCEILRKLKSELEVSTYDYNGVFFGSNEYPRWAGYSAGYYIAKRYLEETGKSVFDAIGASYEEVRDYLNITG